MLALTGEFAADTRMSRVSSAGACGYHHHLSSVRVKKSQRESELKRGSRSFGLDGVSRTQTTVVSNNFIFLLSSPSFPLFS